MRLHRTCVGLTATVAVAGAQKSRTLASSAEILRRGVGCASISSSASTSATTTTRTLRVSNLIKNTSSIIHRQSQQPFHTSLSAQSRYPALYVASSRSRERHRNFKQAVLARRIFKKKHRWQRALQRRLQKEEWLRSSGLGGSETESQRKQTEALKTKIAQAEAAAKVAGGAKGAAAAARAASKVPAQVLAMQARARRQKLAALVNSSALKIPQELLETRTPPAKVTPFLASRPRVTGSLGRRGAAAQRMEVPLPIIPHNLLGTFRKHGLQGKGKAYVGKDDGDANTDGTAAAAEGGSYSNKSSGSIRNQKSSDANSQANNPASSGTIRSVLGNTQVMVIPVDRTPLSRDEAPKVTLPKELEEEGQGLLTPIESLPTRSAGPAYSHGVTISEARTILVDVADALASDLDGVMPGSAKYRAPKKSVQPNDIKSAAAGGNEMEAASVQSADEELLLKEQVNEQAEMVRRVISLENSSGPDINKWNRARMIELFGRKPFDTGSPEVQAAVLTVKIEAIKQHLEKCRKDKSSQRQLQAIQSKRTSMLKYLRRKNLPRFVETCRALGIPPEIITVSH